MTVTEQHRRDEAEALPRERRLPGSSTRQAPVPRTRKIKRVVLIVLGVLRLDPLSRRRGCRRSLPAGPTRGAEPAACTRGATGASGFSAERQFRKIIGYRDLATLVIAIERDHDRRRGAHTATKEAAIVLTA